MSSTNPFDDDNQVTKNMAVDRKSRLAPQGYNPFDDDDEINDHAKQQDIQASSNAMLHDSFHFPSGSGGKAVLSSADTGNIESNQSMEQSLVSSGEAVPIESSWHFLGELPYRRVTLYEGVKWNDIPPVWTRKLLKKENQADSSNESSLEESAMLLRGHGLSAYPPQYLSEVELLDVDLHAYLDTTTATHVVGCPHGGPLAIVSVPKHAVSAGGSKHFASTWIRVVTSSGRLLSMIPFPPPSLVQSDAPKYTAGDLFKIGFTSRTTLIVLLRNSTCLTYKISGELLLPPFAIITKGPSATTPVEVIDAHIFNGGVAILTATMSSSLVELLDEFDDPAYVDRASLTTRKIIPRNPTSVVDGGHDDTISAGHLMGGARTGPPPPHFALVTSLPTSEYAHQRGFYYCTVSVLQRLHTASGRPEVFLSTSDNSVVIVNTQSLDIMDVNCRSRIHSPIVRMSFAPNGRFLACFTTNSMLTVISTNFETKVLDFDTAEGSTKPPNQMEWCGEDSVVLHWKNLGVLMVGPYGDWLRFPYGDDIAIDSRVFLVGEMDSCRIVTHSGRCDILQRVPPEAAQLLRIGSIEPGAMLLDASDAFEAGSPNADEAARAITRTGLLMEAVDICIDAACKEFDIRTQKRLMRAASYGMHFTYKDGLEVHALLGGSTIMKSSSGLDEEADEGEGKEGEHKTDGEQQQTLAESLTERPSETAKKFVHSARKIRVMNALRAANVGFPLSSAQYDEITPTGVIARLVGMGRPALATELSAYLDLDANVQAFARASRAAAFVASDTKNFDTQTADIAIKMLQQDLGSHSIDAALNRGAYATVALAAFRAGRPGVASLILRLETSPTDKVPALIAIGSYADAAAVAASARDTDLIFQSLMDFERACYTSAQDEAKARMKFISTVVQKFPREAYDLLKLYYSILHDVKPINHLLFVGQNFSDAGAHMANQALKMGRSDQEFLVTLREASRIYGLGKECTFQKNCTDDYIELATEQERLRQTYGASVTPHLSSITETIKAVLSYGAVEQGLAAKLIAEADKLSKKFRISEKRQWAIKVQAFSKTGQWHALRALGDSRAKSPIGFKPFALAVIRGNQPIKEIMRYIERVAEKEDRYFLFCEARLWRRALDEAVQMKDIARIKNVRASCNIETDKDIIAECDRAALAVD